MPTKAQLEERIEELKTRCQELGGQVTKHKVTIIHRENDLAHVRQQADNKAYELAQEKQELIAKLRKAREAYHQLRNDYRESVRMLETTLKRAAEGDLTDQDRIFPKW